MDYDVFISHASEDKNNFVRELARKLEEHQILVWYDEFALKPGSGLRKSIDFGLSKSRFGIIVLSENFFKKPWTNWELDGLVARQNSSENDLLLPIWLNISKEKLLEFSPSLADKFAIQSDIGVDQVVKKLLEVLKPEGSTLVVARDYLFKIGIQAPLVTDDWWLDVVEYSGLEFMHHYLSFTIPFKSWEPKDRGIYIARHALQKMWYEEADDEHISQLTHPDKVLKFIEAQPGLKDVCLNGPEKAAFYFPQLAIRGYSGFLDKSFDKLLKKKMEYVTNKTCEEEMALRAKNFGNYDAGDLADFYFTGAGGGVGQPSQRHDLFDCILWLLSANSLWLPDSIRKTLLQGFEDWPVWSWTGRGHSYSNLNVTENTGALDRALFETKRPENFNLTPKIILDITERISHGKQELNLQEDVEQLYQLFIDSRMIEFAIISKHRRHSNDE